MESFCLGPTVSKPQKFQILEEFPNKLLQINVQNGPLKAKINFAK